MCIKTPRPPAIKEKTVKVSQIQRVCKEQIVILWISAIGNFYIIRRQRACKEQTTVQWISAIGNLYRYVDIMGCCPCLSCAELCVCNCVSILRAGGAGWCWPVLQQGTVSAGHRNCSVILNRKYLYQCKNDSFLSLKQYTITLDTKY